MLSSASRKPGVSSACAGIRQSCPTTEPSTRHVRTYCFELRLCLLPHVGVGAQRALNTAPQAGSIHAACRDPTSAAQLPARVLMFEPRQAVEQLFLPLRVDPCCFAVPVPRAEVDRTEPPPKSGLSIDRSGARRGCDMCTRKATVPVRAAARCTFHRPRQLPRVPSGMRVFHMFMQLPETLTR